MPKLIIEVVLDPNLSGVDLTRRLGITNEAYESLVTYLASNIGEIDDVETQEDV